MAATPQNAINSIVHELKSPTASLKMLLQTLEKRMDGHDAQDKQIVQMSLKQTERLSLLINDLLDVARIEQGHLQYSFQEVGISLLVHGVVDIMKASHHSHTFHLKAETAATICADPLRIEQALTNIIGNAIKYSPADTAIRISITEDNENVLIAVKDEGIGITPEQQKHLFDLYYRAPNTTNVKGLGIGLPLSYGIIKAHKGDVLVESVAGHGSTFTIVLPKGGC